MLSIIGTVLLGVLKLVLIAVSVVALLSLCAYLISEAIVSVGYWAAYARNRKLWPYSKTLTEWLWAHVIGASTGITMMLLFAFQQVADALGYYFLSVWTPIIGYFVVALVIATKLHRLWGYDEAYNAAVLLRAIDKAEEPAVQEVPPKADERNVKYTYSV